MNPEDVLPISLTVAEWNVILPLLFELPKRVADPLLAKIQDQAAAHEKAQAPEAEPAVAEPAAG